MTSIVGEKIRETIEARRRDAESIMEEADIAEEAWSEWDVVTLLQMGYITADQMKAIEREMRDDVPEWHGRPGESKSHLLTQPDTEIIVVEGPTLSDLTEEEVRPLFKLFN